MEITRKKIAKKLIDYLQHRIGREELVDWAETMMMEATFPDGDMENLRDIVSRIGLADVKAFGISWEECEDFLNRLGYKVEISAREISGAI